jgi:hypothetical protein
VTPKSKCKQTGNQQCLFQSVQTSKGPFNEGPSELTLSTSHIEQIAARTIETADQLSTDISRSKITNLIEHESRYSKDFCRLARHIGTSAFPHPDED